MARFDTEFIRKIFHWDGWLEIFNQLIRTLFGVVPEMWKQFIEQMFSGMDPINLGGQMFRWYWPAKFDSETPAALVNDSTGNQFRPVTNGQPHCAGGHLKCPALANRHVHLFASLIINCDQQ